MAGAGADLKQAGQGRTEEDRKAWDNAKSNALSNTEHSALQDKVKGMIDYGTWGTTGQRKGKNTVVGET